MSLIKVGEIMEQQRQMKKREKQRSMDYYINKQKYDDIINEVMGSK